MKPTRLIIMALMLLVTVLEAMSPGCASHSGAIHPSRPPAETLSQPTSAAGTALQTAPGDPPGAANAVQTAPADPLMAADQVQSQLSALLPATDSANGWRFDVAPRLYTPDDLFEYINGEAELYNDYHFKAMVTAAYIQGEDLEMTWTLDISDMGSPLDAFGIYSSGRTPELQFAPIGEEATISDLNIRFYQGRYFVQLNAGSFDEKLRAIMMEQARLLAARLPQSESPRELGILAPANQLPHSLKYTTRGFLGQSTFPAGLAAQYRIGDETIQGFVVLTATSEESLAAFARFAASLKGRGSVLEEKAGLIEVETPYQGRILAVHHLHWITGVMGHKAAAPAHSLLAELLANLGE